MWRLNQLSSTVHTVWSPQHCKTQGRVTGVDTQNVLWLHLHESGIYFMELCWSNKAGNERWVYLCVRESEWLIWRQTHSSSFKEDHRSCRSQLHWWTPRFLFWCAWTRKGRRFDILKHSWRYAWWLQTHEPFPLSCQVNICAKVLCERHNACYVIMMTVYFTTSSGLGAS